MITFDLTYYRQIRLWLDEPDEIQPISGNKQIRNFKRLINDNPATKTIIIELLIPVGGRIIYGLLGLKYTPSNNNCLEIFVHETEKNISVFENSLISFSEPAYIGLPNEYSKFILDYIESINGSDLLNLKGKIDFCYAAHGEVSSNGSIFKTITHILLTLLQANKEKINKQMLETLLDNFNKNNK